jgi:hypothetical protein
LGADQERLDAARGEERERREEVEEADALVVDGREPAEQSRPLFPDQIEPFVPAPRNRWSDDGYFRLSR